MENKKRALGRGLEQLFNNENLDLDSFEKSIYESSNSDEIYELDLNDLRPNPYQPRTNFDDESLEELAASIKEHGVFQPIIVKKSIKGYDIVAGERRYRASKLAGNKTIPAIVRDFSDEDMMEIALLENLQRENLNPIEEANAYKKMLERLSITQEQLSKKLGKSRSYVTNMIGLLRLPDSVKELVEEGKLTMGHARVLSKIEDDKKVEEMAKQIVNDNLTVRDVEGINTKKEKPKKKAADLSKYKYVEDMIREKLDTKVKITDKKIEIAFTSDADLNRILEVLDIKE